jgi:L-asparaginase / beta-aspartyl-peptidase
MVLEDDPTFNAGTGSVLTVDGRAQLDAGIMDGGGLHVGAVAGVERIKNPIRLAYHVLRSPHVLLMGQGAERFAEEQRLPLCDPADLVTHAQYAAWSRGYRDGDDFSLDASVDGSKRSKGRRVPAAGLSGIEDDDHEHGTVGAVAMDAQGRVAAGTSTGGIAAKHPGRVGDTPLVGCGFYAEAGLGGVSCTGHGEDFIRLLLARRAAELMGAGLSAQAAATAAITLLGERTGGEGGLSLIDAAGRIGAGRNTPAMSYAYIVEGMDAPIASV